MEKLKILTSKIILLVGVVLFIGLDLTELWKLPNSIIILLMIRVVLFIGMDLTELWKLPNSMKMKPQIVVEQYMLIIITLL